jgi:hypothetical protein
MTAALSAGFGFPSIVQLVHPAVPAGDLAFRLLGVLAIALAVAFTRVCSPVGGTALPGQSPTRDHLRKRRAKQPAVPVQYLARQIRELGHKDSSNLLARYLKQGPHGGEPPAPVPAGQHAPAHQGRQPHGTSAPHHNGRPEEINTKTKMIGRHMHGRAASPPGHRILLVGGYDPSPQKAR